MKKKWLSLLILGFLATLVHAESSMKISGRLDMGYGVSNGGDFTGQGGRDGKFQQWGNAKTQSVWMIDAKEQLSADTAIYTHLESSLSLETGASKGFDRDAYLGVSNKKWGQLHAGRQQSIFNYKMAKYDLSGRNNLTSAVNMAGVSSQTPRYNHAALGRFHSSLVYMSPDIHGFKANAGLVLKNDDILRREDQAKNIYEVLGEYSHGKFDIAAGFRSKVDANVNHAWGVAARYDFDTFIVSAGFFNNNMKEDGKGYFVGARVPVGSWKLGGQVAYNTDASVETRNMLGQRINKKVKPFAWELYAYYNLSKRSMFYSTVGGLNGDGEEYQQAERKYSAAVGLMHFF